MNWQIAMRVATKALKDYATGPDGETYAIGRGLGVVLFVFGLIAPSVLAVWVQFTQKPSLSEWTGFIAALGAYLPALAGATAILVWGTNPTEPPDPTRMKSVRPPSDPAPRIEG